MNMTRVISILNFKGGTGKSSLAENLSYALSLQGMHILVIDADRQVNSSGTLLAGHTVSHTLTQVIREECSLAEATYQARDRLFVVPSDTNLDKASSYLNTTPEAFSTLKECIQDLTGYDIVLIDHAGAYTPVMQAALLASEEMLVPCELEPYATSGLFSMFDKLKQVLRKHTIRNSGIIPYNVDLRYGMSRQYLRELRETFNGLIIAPVRTDALVPKAQSVKMTVLEYEATYGVKSRAAEDFRTLAADLLEDPTTRVQEVQV
jgi:chromosome partitioning protein